MKRPGAAADGLHEVIERRGKDVVQVEDEVKVLLKKVEELRDRLG